MALAVVIRYRLDRLKALLGFVGFDLLLLQLIQQL